MVYYDALNSSNPTRTILSPHLSLLGACGGNGRSSSPCPRSAPKSAKALPLSHDPLLLRLAQSNFSFSFISLLLSFFYFCGRGNTRTAQLPGAAACRESEAKDPVNLD
uniref:Uncharacterized protein n=1 Tax=Setaria viridis TaxID=4556 RepID=A0A4U6TBR0_SETVI|nr:hypothetical protein SEVIR_9G523100v2 [Setaria viridis]